MKNGNGRLWKIGVTVLFAAIGVVYCYGKLNGRFEAVEKEVPKINKNENAVIGIQKDVEYIKDAVDKNAVILREIEKKL